MQWEKGAPRSRRQLASDVGKGLLEIIAGAGIALGVARHAPEWYQRKDHPSSLPALAVGAAAGLTMHGLERMCNKYYVPAHEHDYSALRVENAMRNNHQTLARAARRIEELIGKYVETRNRKRNARAAYDPPYAMAY